MELGSLIFRLFLAGVFGLAGYAKLADLAGSRKTAGDFGVPASLVGFVAVALPAFEIGIAVLLLFNLTSWYGATGAAILLVLFALGMVYQMAKGNAPDCHCFGQIHSRPVGVSSLFRNLFFLVPAVVLISKGRADQGMSIASVDRDSLQLMLLIAAVLLMGIVIDILRRVTSKQDEIVRRIDILEVESKGGGQVERENAGSPHDGLPIGATVPSFDVTDLGGVHRTTRSITSENVPVLFFFVSPTCTPCKVLVPKFREWAESLSGKVNIVMISSGTIEENSEKFGDLKAGALFVDDEREFADAVGAKWTPSALYVDQNGKIASHIAAGDTAIVELVRKIEAADLTEEFTYFTSVNGHNEHNRIELGRRIPKFETDSIDGRKVSSEDLHGKKTLVTFWSSTCSHCERMAPDLKEWDLSRQTDEPNLVLFSDGDIEPHVKLGLKAPIILDRGNQISEKLGMFGTPSAVLIDEKGRFASEIAVGAKHIWSLIGKRK